MTLLASSYDQSKYLKAEDFAPGQEKKLKIKKGAEELIGIGADQKKMLVLWFTNSDKGLPLNRTNTGPCAVLSEMWLARGPTRSSSCTARKRSSGAAWFRRFGSASRRRSKQQPATDSRLSRSRLPKRLRLLPSRRSRSPRSKTTSTTRLGFDRASSEGVRQHLFTLSLCRQWTRPPTTISASLPYTLAI